MYLDPHTIKAKRRLTIQVNNSLRILHARTGELITFLLPDFRRSLLPPHGPPPVLTQRGETRTPRGGTPAAVHELSRHHQKGPTSPVVRKKLCSGAGCSSAGCSGAGCSGAGWSGDDRSGDVGDGCSGARHSSAGWFVCVE